MLMLPASIDLGSVVLRWVWMTTCVRGNIYYTHEAEVVIGLRRSG